MSKSSDAVKRWRTATKSRIVSAMGGHCQTCGYKKCNAALDLHHTDKSKKDFSFGQVIGHPRAWNKIVVELRKCVLVCSNCHREIHAEVRELPEKFAVFDEGFEDYRPGAVETSCPVCCAPKPPQNVTCSHACAATLARKADWSLVDWSVKQDMNALAERFGVTSRAAYKAKNKWLQRQESNLQPSP